MGVEETMARTYIEIQNEITRLQKAAETARQQEVQAVIARIKLAIEAYGITARELGLAGAAAAPRKAVRPSQGAGYRDAAGNTWSGRGRRPGWVNAALATGRTLDELRA